MNTDISRCVLLLAAVLTGKLTENSFQSGSFLMVAILSLIHSSSLSFLRCPVFRRLREEAEKRKRPSWNELKSRKADRESPGDAKQHSTTTKTSRDQPEPGMINPAFEESEDGTAAVATPQTKTHNTVA